MKVGTANMGLEEAVRALDHAGHEEWAEATAALDGVDDPVAEALRSFFARMLARDRARDGALSRVRHDLANTMSIALANAEGMADGAVRVTPARLSNICQALRSARGLLESLRESRMEEVDESEQR
jgi:hypothetical protein